ncbi:glycerate kinase type-2 family protein [Chachezhania antarctica]|uniref:glycerate kinase type-2 family protein n=1 Tax=Chachezhania antarctica TaxID=2340860 RepID=UPI001F096970|nr:glycerate kinase [Chachezhania antarctica]|tara:strand:+ start:4606 stop:5895 length:1290 start_codon:yes stop_codon:yes gene_type:complete
MTTGKTTPAMTTTDGLLRAMFDAAVSAAQPDICVPPHLPRYPATGRLVVIGAGKASAAMARAAEAHYGRPLEGLVVTRYGYAVDCDGIEIVEAAHPVPDAAGRDAAERMLALVEGLGPDDVVVCLISGGGSALLPLPADDLTLEDKQQINRDLLRCGATIDEMNCLRRHMSAIKGGRLAAACHPATLVNLLISDVPGDDPINIASGPSVGDPTTCADALEIVDRYGLTLPAAARQILETGAGESVKPDDPRLSTVTTHMIAAPQQSLEAAANVAAQAGYATHILGDSIEGEASDVGIVMSGIASQVVTHGQPFAKPCVLISGGETTVTLRGDGRGGRNVEFLLSLAVALNGLSDVYAIAGDTDGVDGIEEIAGAVIRPDTLARAMAIGISAKDFLIRNDGHSFFERLGDQVITGPTLTNVNDFRAILIL